jgi:trans-aconitate methyltransferase
MSHENWKAVWNRRSPIKSDNLTLDELLQMDGFDSGAGRISAADWQKYADTIANKLNLENNHSVFELGCGAGAFLFALRQSRQISIGGIDYSKILIEAAKQALPDGCFQIGDAETMTLSAPFDFVISNSVFQYFPLATASRVLANMLTNATCGIAILDIPDLETREASEQLRRAHLPDNEYQKKYRGLAHTYYSRDWFKSEAKHLGFCCQTFDGCIPNYAQNQFRFGAIIQKSNS